MKNLLSLLGLIVVLGLSSCIKDEPLYREADIESFSIEGNGYISSFITNNKIQVLVADTTDYRRITPIINLSAGATVEPASGIVQNFSNDVIYTVTSEDKQYTKEYIVSVTTQLNFKYDFENWFMDGLTWKYPTLMDLSWKSANSGIATAKLGNVPRYPTRDTTDCVSGKKAALLETLEGGTYIAVGYVPVFSGSLFRGKFELQMSNPAKSTLFGQLLPKSVGKPVRFTGYYKYSAGKTLINKDGVVANKKDELAIYSVLYKITKGSDESLDGTDITNSSKIIASAILEDRTEKANFTKFDIPFTYSEEPDYDKYDYKLAVVFASSKNGDFYEGAVGSKLTIDDVEIEMQDYKNQD